MHRLPALVVGNQSALSELMLFTARRSGVVELSAMSAEQRQQIKQMFTDALLLDAQIHNTTPVSDGAVAGFSLRDVQCGVPIFTAKGYAPLLCTARSLTRLFFLTTALRDLQASGTRCASSRWSPSTAAPAQRQSSAAYSPLPAVTSSRSTKGPTRTTTA